MTHDAETERGGPEAREDVVFRALGDEWVLFDTRQNQIHVLNLSAALVWTNLDGRSDEEALAQELVRAFDAAPPLADVRLEVREILDGFRREGLLR